MTLTLQDYLASLKGKRVAVIGIGVSNRPLIELLLSRGVAVTACDRKDRAALGALAEEFQVSYDALLREPADRSRLETILALLEGRSEAYIEWAEKILRTCGERPEK